MFKKEFKIMIFKKTQWDIREDIKKPKTNSWSELEIQQRDR